VIERGVRGQFGRRLEGLNREEVAAAARALVEEQPRTLSTLARLLDERFPGRDAFALGQAIRAWVPLVRCRLAAAGTRAAAAPTPASRRGSDESPHSASRWRI